jgi:hypothetical protein
VVLLPLYADVILSGMLIHYAIRQHKLRVYHEYHVIPTYAMGAYGFQVRMEEWRERGQGERRLKGGRLGVEGGWRATRKGGGGTKGGSKGEWGGGRGKGY